jgi:hypothetical protein
MAGAKCGDRAVRAVYEDHAATAEHDDSGCLDLCDVHHMLFHKAVSERKEVEQRCWYHMSLLSLRLFFGFLFWEVQDLACGGLRLERFGQAAGFAIVKALSDVLVNVWSQVMVHDAKIVRLGTQQFPVSTSKTKRLRQVEFTFDGKTIIGIEQNPGTKSRWAQEARSGKMVMQFIEEGRYIAVVSAGKVTMYGKRDQWYETPR